MTTIGFEEDVERFIRGVGRVLEPGGTVLLGDIERDSRVGQHYQAITDEPPGVR